MLTPRHRFNYVAMGLGIPPDLDGFTNRAAPDELTKALEASIRACRGAPAGPKKPTAKQKARSGSNVVPITSPLFPRAYETFQLISMRKSYDAVLLTTLDVPKAAQMLREKEAVVQIYSDYFFDIMVFEGPTDRMGYLDAIFRRDPEYAQTMRNMLTVPFEQLMFVSNNGVGGKVEPKTVLEEGMTLHYNLMKLFSQLKLETLMSADVESADFKRFKELFGMALASSGMAHKFAAELLKNDLDKDRISFLDEFVLSLTKGKLTEHISSPKTEELELH